MIALKILDTNKFMTGFLKGTMLDHYQIVEGSVTTFCTFTIDGIWQKDFFDTDEDAARRFAPWMNCKDYCFSLIRGARAPLAFKFVFYYPEGRVEELLRHYQLAVPDGEAYGLCLNLRYDASGLVLTSGVSKRLFSLDKAVDNAWDSYLKAFLKHYQIASEPM